MPRYIFTGICLTFSSLLLLWEMPQYQSAGATSAQQANAPAADMKPYVETMPGANVKFEMVPIPGGTYTMGSPESEARRGADEGPTHEVSVRPFWMSKTEVTWDEYDQFAFAQRLKTPPPTTATNAETDKSADAVTRPTPPYADESFGYGKGRLPAISITHHAAMEYCRWLSAKTGKTYRLPTEAEWEHAARAGTKTAYSFGGDDAKKLGEYAWVGDKEYSGPHAVGTRKPNAFGLFDMHGNVAEWVIDHYDPKFYATFKPGAPAMSPVVLPTERRYPHVARGGGWDQDAKFARSAARQASDKSWSRQDPQVPQSIWWHTEATNVGFRIVRPLEEQENLKGLKSKVVKTSPN
ncbi:MAG: formylglycine-generating enzyme family protein [Acidobacteriota bacterium]|nr:formylglycine-generating enzyme family protein [Acidobacteriota bacterium]